MLVQLSQFIDILPWPEQDLERWEEKYHKDGCRTSRIQYADEETQAQLRAIEREIENLPHEEEPRTNWMEQYESGLALRQAFYTRAYCKIQRIARAQVSQRYYDVPDSLKRRLTAIFLRSQ